MCPAGPSPSTSTRTKRSASPSLPAKPASPSTARSTWPDAGDTVVVPAGVPHSEGNTGTADIEGTVELRPALLAKELHEAFAGLVADGNTTPRGAPKNPLQLGATFWHFRHESRVTSPPIWAQNLFLPPLWALAKVFGVRSYYDRWDSRVQEVT